jgi:hypothetical protein
VHARGSTGIWINTGDLLERDAAGCKGPELEFFGGLSSNVNCGHAACGGCLSVNAVAIFVEFSRELVFKKSDADASSFEPMLSPHTTMCHGEYWSVSVTYR